MNKSNTAFNPTEDMINKSQQLKSRRKLKFYKNLSNYYKNMKNKMDEDLFARKAQGSSKTYNEILLLMKFLQTKPQVKNVNIKCYCLYYTVL